MNLFVTDDLASACREAHESFTHNVIADMSWSVAPRIFDTAPIADYVTALYAPWHGDLGQVKKWQAKGGLMLWRNKDIYPPEHDVLLMVEPPPTVGRLLKFTHGTTAHVVVQRPIWSSMQTTVDLHNPSSETAKRLFEYCKGRRADLLETAEELDIPVQYLSRMWGTCKARKFSEVIGRMMPDTEEGRAHWPNLDAAPKHLLRAWSKAGNIVIKRGAVFGTEPPNYDLLDRKRAEANANLNELRSLLESAPVRPIA